MTFRVSLDRATSHQRKQGHFYKELIRKLEALRVCRPLEASTIFRCPIQRVWVSVDRRISEQGFSTNRRTRCHAALLRSHGDSADCRTLLYRGRCDPTVRPSSIRNFGDYSRIATRSGDEPVRMRSMHTGRQSSCKLQMFGT